MSIFRRILSILCPFGVGFTMLMVLPDLRAAFIQEYPAWIIYGVILLVSFGVAVILDMAIRSGRVSS